MKKLIYLLLPFAVLANACSDTIKCLDGYEDVVCLEPAAVQNQPLTGNFTLKNVPDNQVKTALLIKDQAMYELLVQSDTALPSIDFTKQVLVAIRVRFPSCFSLSQQSLNVNCKTITYSAANTTGPVCLKPTDFFLFTLIDVKYKNYELALNVPLNIN